MSNISPRTPPGFGSSSSRFPKTRSGKTPGPGAYDQKEVWNTGKGTTFGPGNSRVKQKKEETIDRGYRNNLGIETDCRTEVQRMLKAIPKIGAALVFKPADKIGSGASQDVYKCNSDETGPLVVVKIMRDSIGKRKDDLIQEAKILNQQYSALERAFRGNKIEEYGTVQQIKIDGDIKWAIVVVGPYETTYEDNTAKVELSDRPLRWALMDQIEHSNEFEILLSTVFSIKKPPLLSGLPITPELVEKIKNDEGFKNKMTDFLKKYKDYFERNGQFFDISGENNVYFFQQDDQSWSYRIGTVTKDITKEKVLEILDEMEGLKQEKFEEGGLHSKKTHIQSALSWIQAFNTLGHLVGIGNVITDKDLLQKIEYKKRWLIDNGLMESPPNENLKLIYSDYNQLDIEAFEKKYKNELKDKDDRRFQLMLECLEGEPNAIKKTKLASFLFERIKVLEPIDRTVFGYFHKLGHLMKNGGVDDKKIAYDCFVNVLGDPDGPQEQMKKEIDSLHKRP